MSEGSRQAPGTVPTSKPIIGSEERAAVDAVLASGMIAQGHEVAAFEEEFADALVGGRECVAVSSGTTGLHLGLLAAGVGAGHEVIVPSFTFAATANAVALTGASPVFADIDPATFCLDPGSVAERISSRTRGIIPVHLYGQPADMTALAQLAAERGVGLFEDAAQAHGATWNGAPVGSFGEFGLFSLYPTKNMTSGEGGMVSCAGAGTAGRVRLLRNQGMERQYVNEVVGFNARMSDIHAAIGRVQLGKLPAWTSKRRANAAFLDEHLQGVATPAVRTEARHVYHQYTVRLVGADGAERDAFARALRTEHAVGCGVYYPIPCHRLESLSAYAPGGGLGNTEQACREVLSLPVHPSLTEADLERIVAGVNAVAKAGA